MQLQRNSTIQAANTDFAEMVNGFMKVCDSHKAFLKHETAAVKQLIMIGFLLFGINTRGQLSLCKHYP